MAFDLSHDNAEYSAMLDDLEPSSQKSLAHQSHGGFSLDDNYYRRLLEYYEHKDEWNQYYAQQRAEQEYQQQNEEQPGDES